MNYGELKKAIVDDTHRGDLTQHVPRFIRQCEGMIRRDLKAYLLTGTLTDTNRVAAGLYNLPVRALELRHVSLQGRQGDGLQQVAPGQIRRLDASADVIQYARNGNRTIEFRGVPGVGAVFDILYYGTPPPFATDTDVHSLLTDHETLYMAGAKFFLYEHTQDFELAQMQLDIYKNVIETLNEQVARRIGGASIAPAYNFSGGSSY